MCCFFLFFYFIYLGGLVIVIAGDPIPTALRKHCAIQELVGPVLKIVQSQLKTSESGRMGARVAGGCRSHTQVSNLSYLMALPVWGKR